jgi:hypoxanthine phosphoribosyltransferase
MIDLAHVNAMLAQAEQLHTEAELEAALDTMAASINQRLADCNPLVLCVLNGGIVTAGKLLTRLTMPLSVDSINASRYHNETVGGAITWHVTPRQSLQNRVVLLVDDVLDEGITLKALVDYCHAQGASAVYSAVLVEKLLANAKPIRADFVGLNVVNRYIFGYGMDYHGYCRNAAGLYAVAEQE